MPVLLPCHLVSSFLSWTAQLYSDLANNADFFLYVFKNLLNELWQQEKAATSVLIHKVKERTIPDIVSSLTGDESKDDFNVARDKEWFLSEESFPESKAAERARFLNARNGDVQAACAMLKRYLDWRAQYYTIEDEKNLSRGIGKAAEDEKNLSRGIFEAAEEDPDWSQACRMASSLSSSTMPLRTIPPCILFMPEKKSTDIADSQDALRTLDGKRVLQHLPARIDLSDADADVYATALALYIDRCVPRDSMEKICVVIDTRPGKGWRNIPAHKLVPFIKHAARLLNDLHPERLARCILFPVPSVAKFLWNAVKPWLDPGTANKICILSGSANIKSPIPKDMELYLQKDVVEWMERKRLSTFEDGSTKRKLEEKLAASVR